ncbi:hypothetical protein D3C76_1389290 [compost metagenome]
MQGHAVGVVVVRPQIVRAHRDQTARADHQRQAEVIMPLLHPAAAFRDGAAQEVGPPAFRQIVLGRAFVVEDRGDEKRVAQHVLAVQRFAGRVARELQDHGAHDRHARPGRFHAGAVQIRHQRGFQLREVAQHVARFIVEQPWHPVGLAAVQAAVRGQ